MILVVNQCRIPLEISISNRPDEHVNRNQTDWNDEFNRQSLSTATTMKVRFRPYPASE